MARQALDVADKETTTLGDSHVATEMILLGGATVNDKAKQLPSDYGASRKPA